MAEPSFVTAEPQVGAVNPSTTTSTADINTNNNSTNITTTNITETPSQSTNETSSKDQPSSSSSNTAETGLPPFSFKKKPLDSYAIMKNRCCTDRPADHNHSGSSSIFHSNISSILPSLSSRKKDSITSTDSTRSRDTVYKDIDYDEQIRFPRMNNMNYYTYGRNDSRKNSLGHGNSHNDRTGITTSSNKTSNTSLTKMDGVNNTNYQNGSDKSSVGAISQEEDPSVRSKDNATLPNIDTNNKDSGSSSNYIPATFDLSQPLRRFSLPMSSNDSSQSIKKSSQAIPFENPILDTDEEDENIQLLKEYAVNNYIYQRNWEQQKLNKAINSFINSEEPESPEEPVPKQHPYYYPKTATRIKNQTSFPSINSANKSTTPPTTSSSSPTNTAESSSNSTNSAANPAPVTATNANGLNQVYQLKKPLITPAVLRPMISNSNSSDIHDGLKDITLPASGKTMYTISSPTTISEETMPNLDEYDADRISVDSIKPSQVKDLTPNTFTAEPTRIHWKTNNFTNHCMQCFKTFGNSIFSMVLLFLDEKIVRDGMDLKSHGRRRHHCRFCGLIYCDDCLIQGDVDETNKYNTSRFGLITKDGGNGILLDNNARFIIPIYRNMSAINSSSSSTKSNVSMNSEATSISQSSLITNPDNYKLFKICKKCGETYKNLVLDINRTAEALDSKGAPVASTRYNCEVDVLQKYPFIFVENPYVGKVKELIAKSHQKKNVVVYKQFAPVTPATEGYAVDNKARNNSVNEVPSDWTWSSF
ncbi:uncharacterized protein RJT20DRAFT_98696 [Scheffersomyces xylosifermentans]|uniref:uncharacterized protein n=1 Tax=Scheffersomyces xylosifermentans TaxID=1304137 RepID=UPI00315CDBE6